MSASEPKGTDLTSWQQKAVEATLYILHSPNSHLQTLCKVSQTCMRSEPSFGEAQPGAGENAAFIMAVGSSDGNSVLKVVVTFDKGKIQGEKNNP